MDDQRHHIRERCSVQVEISHPSFGCINLPARDLSDGGVFVYLGGHTAPPVGTVLKVSIKRMTGLINRAPIDMRVVHHQAAGMGLAFIGA